MIDFFTWAGFDRTRIIIQSLFVVLIITSYIWAIVLDFKYKEMELWKILVVCGLNLILPIVSVFIWGAPCLRIPILFTVPIWAILVFANTKLNKESVIGQADLDILACQFSIAFVLVVYMLLKLDANLAWMIALLTIQSLITALFIGLVALCSFWLAFLFLKKLKNKNETFKDIVKENRNVPTIVAFLPIIVTNLYFIMSI